MLPKKYRLIKREDFAIVYSKGLYCLCNGIAIKYTKTGKQVVRIGFSVGKNFSKKAVERNRAKRILRSACFSFISSLKPGFDIVVMISPKCQKIKTGDAILSLGRIFKKSNLITTLKTK